MSTILAAVRRVTSVVTPVPARQAVVPPELIARVSALSIFPAYGLLSSAAVLTLPSVRGVTWMASEQDKP
jgi:hypothetical protein